MLEIHFRWCFQCLSSKKVNRQSIMIVGGCYNLPETTWKQWSEMGHGGASLKIKKWARFVILLHLSHTMSSAKILYTFRALSKLFKTRVWAYLVEYWWRYTVIAIVPLVFSHCQNGHTARPADTRARALVALLLARVKWVELLVELLLLLCY